MLYQSPEEELKALEKRQVMLSIVDAPGAILVGLALYGKFNGKGRAFHPLLDDSNVTTVMLTVGAVIMGWCLIQIIAAARRRQELLRVLDT